MHFAVLGTTVWSRFIVLTARYRVTFMKTSCVTGVLLPGTERDGLQRVHNGSDTRAAVVQVIKSRINYTRSKSFHNPSVIENKPSDRTEKASISKFSVDRSTYVHTSCAPRITL